MTKPAEWVRLTKDDKGRAVVTWGDGRKTPGIRRYAEIETARAIVERLNENGNPRRGFAAERDA